MTHRYAKTKTGYELFPFLLLAEETPHFTSSPYAFRPAFLANVPKDLLPYFAFDVEVKSPTHVVFTVYDMRDTCYGGIGKAKGTFEATVDPEITKEFILRQATFVAKRRRADEKRAAEEALIAHYAAQVLIEAGFEPATTEGMRA
jgi:hypothetical protein